MASVAPQVTRTSRSGSSVDAVPALLVGDDGGAQLGDPRAGRVLVAAALGDGVERGLAHLVRPVRVGEALAEVDGLRGHGQRGHLGEDRRAEALQLGRQVRLTHAR